ncbi:hypothetical protein BZZ01_03755 [Nostocales cyanobacterium HT-58-2]|nr:hypothetical protein BZZ01_03755 [Nostocales cyanobacterium HT-58-2]
MLYQARREQVLNRVIQAIRSTLDLETIFSTAVEEIGKLLQVDHVKISQYLPEKKIWLTLAHYRSRLELPLSVGDGIPDEGNPVTVQLKRLEIARISDVSLCEDEVCRKIAEKFPGAWLILPLYFNREVWGSLCVLIDGHPHHWQDSEVELATAVADQLAIAIQQSQLYQQTLYQARRAKGLNRVIQAIRSTLDLETIFSTAVEEIGKRYWHPSERFASCVRVFLSCY